MEPTPSWPERFEAMWTLITSPFILTVIVILIAACAFVEWIERND